MGTSNSRADIIPLSAPFRGYCVWQRNSGEKIKLYNGRINYCISYIEHDKTSKLAGWWLLERLWLDAISDFEKCQKGQRS